MTVVHLHRPTNINRTSMSAANIICAKYPKRETIHTLVWGIIAKQPNKAFPLAELEFAVKQLLRNKVLAATNKLPF